MLSSPPSSTPFIRPREARHAALLVIILMLLMMLIAVYAAFARRHLFHSHFAADFALPPLLPFRFQRTYAMPLTLSMPALFIYHAAILINGHLYAYLIIISPGCRRHYFRYY